MCVCVLERNKGNSFTVSVVHSLGNSSDSQQQNALETVLKNIRQPSPLMQSLWQCSYCVLVGTKTLNCLKKPVLRIKKKQRTWLRNFHINATKIPQDSYVRMHITAVRTDKIHEQV